MDIVGGRCSKFPLTCSLYRTSTSFIGTRNGLHDPKKLEILVDPRLVLHPGSVKTKVNLTIPYLVTMVAKLQSYHEKLVNLTNFLIDVQLM